MSYADTDTTQMDWSESEQCNPTERCPITGVSMAPGFMLAEYSRDARGDSLTIHREGSDPKLQEMFDKFLYRR